MELSDLLLSVDSEDKVKIPFGNPGRTIDTNAQHINHKAMVPPPKPKIGEPLDHSYHIGSISTSTNLHQIIPACLEESWVTGQVKVTLDDYVCNGSHGINH
jgi:hypothetical protein